MSDGGDGERVAPCWWLTKDGDVTCLALYERHYSAHQYRDGRIRKIFAGPGEKICLRTLKGDAAFVWRKFIDPSGEQGVNCAFFRNEGSLLSSELVRQADRIADQVWAGRRHYTYVDAAKVRSRNVGYCFLVAGWNRTGRVIKGSKLVLEKAAP